MATQGSRGSVPSVPVPLMARLRYGAVSPWFRVGTVRRRAGGFEAVFDRTAGSVAPAWWARTAACPTEGPVVQFGAVARGVVVIIGQCPVDSGVLFDSCRAAPRERAPWLCDGRSGAPAPLRSNFPDASRFTARRTAA